MSQKLLLKSVLSAKFFSQTDVFYIQRCNSCTTGFHGIIRISMDLSTKLCVYVETLVTIFPKIYCKLHFSFVFVYTPPPPPPPPKEYTISTKSIRNKFSQDIYLEFFVIFVASSILRQTLLNPPQVIRHWSFL